MQATSVDTKPAVLVSILKLLEKGWNIFPVEKNGKRPVVVKTSIDEDGKPYDVRMSWKEFEYNRISSDQIQKCDEIGRAHV